MKFKYSPLLALFAILMLVLSACGGTAAPAPTAAPAGGGAAAPTTAGAAAEQPTAAPAEGAAEQPTAAPAEGAAPQPTAAIEFQSEAQAGQKTLVWMVRQGPVENPWERDVVIPAWQKAHPDIFVKVLNIRQDDIAVKREAMIAAGEQLDVWSTNWGGDGFASDRARNLITDLTPLIERDKYDLSDFVPDVLKIYQSEGKTWGLPFLTTGSYIYYNMKLFDEAKIPYPPTDWDDPSWTWDKYVEVAKQLTKNIEDPNTGVYGTIYARLNLEGPPMIFGQFVWPEDAYTTGYADKVTVTDPKSIEAYQAFHDLVYKHKVAPDPATTTALDQLGGVFQSGRVAMAMNGGWGHWAYKGLIDDPKGFCWGAAPLPMGSPDAKIRAVIYTDPWVITRGLAPEQQDLAWEFVKFLVSSEQAASYTKATGTPPTQTALLADYYQQFSKCMAPDKAKQVFEGAFSHGRESSNHLLVKWDSLNQAWNNILDPFFSDPSATAADVLPQVEEAVNAQLTIINQEKTP